MYMHIFVCMYVYICVYIYSHTYVFVKTGLQHLPAPTAQELRIMDESLYTYIHVYIDI